MENIILAHDDSSIHCGSISSEYYKQLGQNLIFVLVNFSGTLNKCLQSIESH